MNTEDRVERIVEEFVDKFLTPRGSLSAYATADGAQVVVDWLRKKLKTVLDEVREVDSVGYFDRLKDRA